MQKVSEFQHQPGQDISASLLENAQHNHLAVMSFGERTEAFPNNICPLFESKTFQKICTILWLVNKS